MTIIDVDGTISPVEVETSFPFQPDTTISVYLINWAIAGGFETVIRITEIHLEVESPALPTSVIIELKATKPDGYLFDLKTYDEALSGEQAAMVTRGKNEIDQLAYMLMVELFDLRIDFCPGDKPAYLVTLNGMITETFCRTESEAESACFTSVMSKKSLDDCFVGNQPSLF